MNLNFKNFLVENILIDFPYSIIFIMFALLLCGFKYKITFKQILLFALLQTTSDSIITLILKQYGAQPIPYAISGAIFIAIVFKIDLFSSIISSTISSITGFLTQMPLFLTVLFILGEKVNKFENNTILKLKISYSFYLLIALLIFLIYKSNFSILNLKDQSLFSKIWGKGREEFTDNLKIITFAVLPILIFIGVNYSIYYYQAYNNIQLSFFIYVLISSVSILITIILMLLLIKKMFVLKQYKLEWKIQQNYLNDINELLKVLRTQRHGFINHISIINGLLTLKEYDNAKDYLSGIHETISVTNIITLENPTINALINAKAGVAENKKVKFEVKADSDLSKLNFKAFEIGEAIGNIIDNAFDATCEFPEDKRYIKIIISSKDNYYIFNIENSGKTIPEEIINKIFDQGFTTKSHEIGDHGFGLYISKTFIENYQGKIELESKDNYTSFKIILPKVMQNEFKAS